MVDIVLNHGFKQGFPYPYLPRDVLDTVIDVLGDEWLGFSEDQDAQDARDALCQCMLVSYAFFVRARKHIFERLHRNCERREPVTARDIAFFSDSPSECPSPNGTVLQSVLPSPKTFLRDVNIAFDNDERDEETIQKRLARLHTFLTLEGLASTQLKTFFFQAEGEYRLRAAVLAFIPTICSSTSITTLLFSNLYDFPMDALSHCSNLRSLSLIDVYPKGNSTYEDTWNKEGFCNLTFLELDSQAVYDAVFPQVAFENEKAFARVVDAIFLVNGSMSEGHILQEFEIIRRSSNTLERLCIDVVRFGAHIFTFVAADETDEDLAQRGTFELSSFPRLILLDLKFFLKTHEPFPKRFFSLFTELHSPSTIHTMNLTFSFDNPPHDADKDDPIPVTEDWSTLDDILVNRSIFPRLTFLGFLFKISVIYRPIEGLNWRRFAMHRSKMQTFSVLHRLAKSAFPKVAGCPLIKDERECELG
ncbi:hypothetical protein NLJ89_g9131 [Agrocybe chaxingu]|uniref:Uncharacterized protein n=1 Tax=Agrocybe chaxingu TaxID=84603 RepID=A0A9W8JU36_9AGAR|nr:hypothetical protein NLJ89_g9131 [Agrocybe chaxingu]